MVILKGTGVSEGIAFGRIFINKPKNSKSEKIEIKDANEEICLLYTSDAADEQYIV